jgi:hypothetical protein
MADEQKPLETAKIHANPIEPNLPTGHQIVTPKAMAELEIIKNEGAKSVTGRNLEVRNVALLLLAVLGINLFSQFSSLLIANSMGTNHSGVINEFVKSNGFVGIAFLLIQLIAIFVLLFTRNVSVAKIILVVAAIGVAVNIVRGLIGFDIGPNLFFEIAILGVNFFIFRKIFIAYQSL